MPGKNQIRLRRARHTRARIRGLGAVRLSFHKTNQHLYAQLVAPVALGECDKILATLSTSGRKAKVKGKNIKAADELGSAVAAKAKELGLHKVAFDRGGNKYHGRVKSFAEAARQGGLEF